MPGFNVVMSRVCNSDPPRIQIMKARSKEIDSSPVPVYSGDQIVVELQTDPVERLYSEEAATPGCRSFVLYFGWCYDREGKNSFLNKDEMAGVLNLHRKKKLHDSMQKDRWCGQYCLLSYDHVSRTLWAFADAWGQHGFFYGADNNHVMVASQAAWIAEKLNSSIHGQAYLAMLRGVTPSPGDTLFTNVYRTVFGQSVYIDFNYKKAKVVRSFQPVVELNRSTDFRSGIMDTAESLKSVVGRAAKAPQLAFDLTGGNDTRLSAAAFVASGSFSLSGRLCFKVHQSPEHPDFITAKQIADLYHWELRRLDRDYDIQDATVDDLFDAARLSDGRTYADAVLRNAWKEKDEWGDRSCLLGSLGGELLRGFFWLQETYRMGLSRDVNYDALLKHRLYAATNLNIDRLSDGVFSLDEHDSYLLSGYRDLAELNASQKNVYKLDRIYLLKLMLKYDGWEYSAFRTKMLPLLTSEVLEVILALPWTYRIGRQLLKSVIFELTPELCEIPHDTGLSMQPLKISNIHTHTYDAVSEMAGKIIRHYGHVKPTGNAPLKMGIPKSWIQYADEKTDHSEIYNKQLLNRALQGIQLSQNEIREVQMSVLIHALSDAYPGVKKELAYNASRHHPFCDRFEL